MDSHDRLVEALAAHERRVFSYLRRMGLDHETARDLAQETFVRAIRGAHGFRGDAPVEAWLLGIARNVLLAWYRRRRDPLVPAAEATDPPGDERVDVERALAGLDQEDREVLVLRYALDLSGRDTAAILGVSHDALRQRLVRARAAFRAIWSGP